ncbi:MAG TPA: hypothetical protein VGP93_08450 [Polyangiaceae bacterium]|nr:hypothetical protein [Polyangiaceae bacterium]
MPVRIFAQGEPRLDLPRLLQAMRNHFSASLEVLRADQSCSWAVLRIESERHGYSGNFRVNARLAQTSDYVAADEAELRGRAAGMAGLARRCHTVLEILPEAEHQLEQASALDDAPLVNLCAVLASVALGPVLPEDGSTLLGVRSSMERLERLLGPPSLLR